MDNMNISMELNKPAPNFKLPASSGKNVSLSQFIGKKVVIFFYPQDLTPTCTKEACFFRDFHKEFKKLKTVVLGISPDTMKTHNKFIEQNMLPYLLLADKDHEVCDLYGVWKMKTLYGRDYMGVERCTFLIDEQGILVREWRKIRVAGHVEQVLEAIKVL